LSSSASRQNNGRPIARLLKGGSHSSSLNFYSIAAFWPETHFIRQANPTAAVDNQQLTPPTAPYDRSTRSVDLQGLVQLEEVDHVLHWEYSAGFLYGECGFVFLHTMSQERPR